MALYALDFETEAIEPRPKFPPRPVGLSIWRDGEKNGCYTCWGHPTNNNTENSLALRNFISDLLWDTGNEFVFHNAAFDCSIIAEIWQIKIPWDRVHDTMLMAFLLDPYGQLGLKPLAERYLDEPPEEQDAVREWLLRHGKIRSNEKSWGAKIALAPGDLVGEYANGDTGRTLRLFHHFSHILRERGLI